MMKNILIVCDLFPPQFAPRMGYFCKFAIEAGFGCTVLTAKLNIGQIDKDFSFLAPQTEIIRIEVSEYEQKNKLARKKKQPFKRLKNYFCPDYRYAAAYNEKMFFSGLELFKQYKFDLILCSTHTITPLDVARKLSKKFSIPWVADLRDITEQAGKKNVSFIGYYITKVRRNYLLKNAAAITTVSPWHVNTLKKVGVRTHLIYNGFDPDLFKPEKARKTYKFIMCYLGVVVEKYWDVSLLFSGVSILDKDGIFTGDQVEICFYTNEDSRTYIRQVATKYGIERYVRFYDFVKADEVPDILQESSILLLFSRKATPNGPNGIMTSKFFEYLGSGRPILLAESDQSCLEQVLIESNAGKAARTEEDVYEYVKGKFIEWKKYGYTTGTSDEQVVRKFSRKTQANQFLSILKNIS